jgi:flagellar basal-body rod protein FlgB
MRHYARMDYAAVPLLTGLEARMRFAQQKQHVISQNIANADTPGYKARRVVEPNFGKVLKSVEDSGKGNLVVAPRIALPDAFRSFGSQSAISEASVVDTSISEVKPNGNSVSIEDQMSELSNVQIEYGELLNLYRKQLGLFRIALGKSR